MENKLKLHIACGDIYLSDYVNIDIEGIEWEEWMKDHKTNPNLTTFGMYYHKPFEKDKKKSKPNKFIVDRLMNILVKWEFPDQSVDEVLMISSIEHFTEQEADFIISEVKRVLKPGGIFRVDFPDIITTVETYYYHDTEFCMRLLYCNHKNEYSIHKWGYSFFSFRDKLGSGWAEIKQEQIVQHDYPMIGIKAVKKS